MKNHQPLFITALAVVTAMSVMLGAPSAPIEAAQHTPVRIAADDKASEGAARALQYLNEVRSKTGVPSLQVDNLLSKAANHHAAYLKTNSLTGHSEESGLPEFTGEGLSDRVKIAGFNTLNKGIWEDIAYGDIVPEHAIAQLIDAPLHRTSLIYPAMTLFGFGYNNHASVVNMASAGIAKAPVVYPYDGQTGVGIGFYGNENPNPLEGFGIAKSGYIISYVGDMASPNDVAASITDSSGHAVDFFKLKQSSVAWHLIPKEELQYNETYTVTVERKTWSFTTAQDKQTLEQQQTSWREMAKAEKEAEKQKELELERQKIMNSQDAPPRQFDETDVGIRINGKYVDVEPRAKVINGKTFIPLRGVFEKLGASVSWSPPPSGAISSTGESVPVTSLGYVRIMKDAKMVKLSIGENYATVGYKSVKLEDAPFILDDATYVPLRLAAEALGAEISWDATTMTASIIMLDQ
ncbi:stalk domain-containing protein [Paenibacillus thalictri]|uniref:Uncharacterized protein n=1 Tax=Paenibacillus thalictri TaxID=2527873 RepID=A0A4Q9DHN9_9BACL|nr:stalk domain-containing protein [Paenibacillus thalictri]TBL72423.1 hypothetical protein EYB31_29000 [Paenibacillus thalictri]